MQMHTLVIIEALFALVFSRAVVLYLRDRDPPQRGVRLGFSSLAVLFVLEMLSLTIRPLPPTVFTLATGLVLLQPFFMLRLIGQLRAVPRWLPWAALAPCL